MEVPGGAYLDRMLSLSLPVALLLSSTGAAQGLPAGAGNLGGPSSDAVVPSPREVPATDQLEFRPQLQYRLRYRHHEGHDFAAGGVADFFRHRARIGLTALYSELLGAIVQLQDVRTLGEGIETQRDSAADSFGLHQAYAILRPFAEVEMRLGRQEISLENQRLIGDADWLEQGRSFDGLRVIYQSRDLLVDGFYSLLRETDGAPGQGSDTASVSTRRHLAGAAVHYELMPEMNPGVVVVTEHDSTAAKHQHTAGSIITGSLIRGILSYSAEGYYQSGTSGGLHCSAFMAGVKARATAPTMWEPYLELSFETLSGDDDLEDLTSTTFEVPFGTNHGFYGELDLFTDLPADTRRRGLRDVSIAAGLEPLEGLEGRATYHLFQDVVDRGDDLSTFGHELDVFIQYKFLRYARTRVFYGWFLPGGIFEDVLAEAALEHFMYVTAEVDLK